MRYDDDDLGGCGGRASSMFRADLILGCVLLVLLYAGASWGLIIVGRGNDPVKDNGWAAGSLDLANLKTRVGWWEGPPYGGGQHQFLYRGDAKAFQAALDALAKIDAPHRRLVVHPGPHDVHFLKDPKDPKADTRVDWTFTVWNANSWNRLFNNPRTRFAAGQPGFRQGVDAPQVDVYVGAGGLIDWTQVKVPPNVTVTDERASAHGIDAGDGGVARGEVADLVTAEPLADVEVRVERMVAQDEWQPVAVTRTGEDGRFLVKGIPAGQGVRLSAAAPRYAARSLGHVEFKRDSLKQFDARLAVAAVVRGRAVDLDGRPLADVTVRADNPTSADGKGYAPAGPTRVTTDAEGNFEITGLPEGEVQLFAHKPNFWPLDPLTVRQVPSDGVMLTLTPTGIVRGRMRCAGGGGESLPAGTAVQLQPAEGPGAGKWSGSSSLAADGRFEFDNVPPGDYLVGASLEAARAGKHRNAKEIRLDAGETVEVELVAE